MSQSSMNRTTFAIRNAEKMRKEKGIVVYVESQDDVCVYKNFIGFECMRFESANGWEKVVELVESFEEDYKDLRIGIIDADLDHITGRYRVTNPKIFVTDTHDLETFLISLLDEEKLLSQGLQKEYVLVTAIEIAKDIGILRFLNNSEGNDKFGLRFRISSNGEDKRLAYYDRSSKLYQNQVFDAVKAFNERYSLCYWGNCHPRLDELKEEYSTFDKTKFPNFQIINGHDLLPIYAKLLTDKSDVYKFDSTNEREFLFHIMNQVDSKAFEKTTLYSNVFDYYSTMLN